MISIVIPARNEEKYLPTCLKSLREQDYKGNYEIIIADNGSTDRTTEIARSFGAQVVPCPEKKGVFYARAVGASAANGDIIIQADADTIYPKHWLRRIYEQFAAHPKAAALSGRWTYTKAPWWGWLEYGLRRGINWLTVLLFQRPMLISGATFAFRRKTFLAVGGYSGLQFSADQWGISGRLSRQGRVLYDDKLVILTSSRSVERPFANILVDVAVNISLWLAYLGRTYMDAFQGSFVPRTTRRMAARLIPTMGVFIIFVFLHGYFIPASPVFGSVYYRVDSSEKVVSLTFDDGPNDPYTLDILDILAKQGVSATFFIIGQNALLSRATVKRILADGHVIGNHSQNHMSNHALSERGYQDMKLAQETIAGITGVEPHLYRPPDGRKSPWELEKIKAAGLIEVTWSVSLDDSKPESALTFANTIVDKTDPGEIILLHDGNGTLHYCTEADRKLTVEALPTIIEKLREKGYRFLTVPQLLGVPAYNN